MRRREFLAAALAACGGALAQEPRAVRSPVQAMRLAVLAERIAKLFCQVGQGVLADRSRRALAEAPREFDALLRAVAGGVQAPEVREGYLLLRLLWEEFRAWAARPPTRDNARKLAERADEVAWVAAKWAPRVGPSRPVALEAARAGVLAQRVPRLHLMRRWAARDEALARRLATDSLDLRRTLGRLALESAANAAVVAELQVAENQHLFLEQGARDAAHGAAPAAYEVIAKAGDNMLESLERAARLLEAGAA